MRARAVRTGPVQDGFDPDDLAQEAAIGILMSERTQPGNRHAARLRARQRMGRHRAKEAEYHKRKAPDLEAVTAAPEDAMFERILVHEILDLLPFALKEEALTVLVSGDGRALRRIGRVIRESLPQVMGRKQ